MFVSARPYAVSALAVLVGGALALTPVGPALQALTLRTETIPPLTADQLPAWMTGGVLNPVHEMAGGLDSGLQNPPAVLNTFLNGVNSVDLGGDVPNSLIPALPAIAEGDLAPRQTEAAIAALASASSALVDTPLTPLIGAISDIAAFNNVVGAVRAVATNIRPFILSLLNIPMTAMSWLVNNGGGPMAALLLAPGAVLRVLSELRAGVPTALTLRADSKAAKPTARPPLQPQPVVVPPSGASATPRSDANLGSPIAATAGAGPLLRSTSARKGRSSSTAVPAAIGETRALKAGVISPVAAHSVTAGSTGTVVGNPLSASPRASIEASAAAPASAERENVADRTSAVGSNARE